jgi:two-component sensor histidine kinase
MPRHVLYIDDDEATRALVSRGLGREGINVVACKDGESGLKALAAQEAGKEFDVVAIDLYMPGMSGIQTTEQINKMPNHPPVIIVTGAQDSRMAVAALKAGAFDYVVKDVGGDFTFLLRSALSTAVDAMRLRRAKEAAEQEVREARDRFEALAVERDMLLREVNHRVGNSLQLIASLLHMQGHGEKNEDIKQALAQATNRVMAVAQVHRRLYTSDDVKSVAVDQYLDALVSDLRLSAGMAKQAQLILNADAVETDPDRAIGVIVNELVMNAMKYAYPTGGGQIRIGLKGNGPDAAIVSVEDDGVGIGGANSAGTGLGQRIVRAMADKLGAQVDIQSPKRGTRIEIAFATVRKPAAAQPVRNVAV